MYMHGASSVNVHHVPEFEMIGQGAGEPKNRDRDHVSPHGLVFKDLIRSEHKMNKHEVAFDQFSMAKQILSKSEEESQNKENGNSRSMGCRNCKSAGQVYIWTRKKERSYVRARRARVSSAKNTIDTDNTCRTT
jgi:hypothetical protein